MAQPSFPSRGAYPGRVPDRSAPSSSQPQFNQSAPGFGRQLQYAQQPQPYSQYGTGTAYGVGRGQGQNGGVAMGAGLGNESNAMNDLMEEQRDEINEAFRLFDGDKDKLLDFHEFKTALRALGFSTERAELVQLLADYGTPKPGAQRIHDGARGLGYHTSQLVLSQQAFTRIAAQKMMDRDPHDEVNRAFELFDADKKGFISLDDLKRVARELGETNLEEQELVTMIQEFDYDGQGGVSREAFFSICLQ